jgi:hypothetical protein
MDTTPVLEYLRGLQDRIVAELAAFDGKPFQTDTWKRPEGGGGTTRLIEEGDFFERGGVNFSHVTGSSLPPSATAARPTLAGRAWEAMGVSLVLHPRNPYCPTAHMNVRCFVARKDGEEPVWWFGGGMTSRLLRLRGGRAPIPRHLPAGPGALRPGCSCPLQEVVRRLLFHQAPQRTARRRRHLLRRSERGGLRPLLQPDAGGRRRLPAGVPAPRRTPPGPALR